MSVGAALSDEKLLKLSIALRIVLGTQQQAAVAAAAAIAAAAAALAAWAHVM